MLEILKKYKNLGSVQKYGTGSGLLGNTGLDRDVMVQYGGGGEGGRGESLATLSIWWK
jgi:hypothetical protein